MLLHNATWHVSGSDDLLRLVCFVTLYKLLRVIRILSMKWIQHRLQNEAVHQHYGYHGYLKHSVRCNL